MAKDIPDEAGHCCWCEELLTRCPRFALATCGRLKSWRASSSCPRRAASASEDRKPEPDMFGSVRSGFFRSESHGSVGFGEVNRSDVGVGEVANRRSEFLGIVSE